MAEEYVLGNFLTGEITHRNIPAKKGTDKVLRDLAGGSVEVEINFDSLPSDVRNNWRQAFKPAARFVALIDNEKALSDPTAVQGWGFVNKVHAPVGKGYIRLQMASMNEYLATLPAVDLWDGSIVEEDTPPGEEPEEKVFSATTWEGLMRTLMSIAFKPSPAGAPQVPSIVTGIAPDAPGDKTILDIADGTTYLSLLEEVRDVESGIGLEWRFNPYFLDANHIGCAFITGTQAAPHINESLTVTVDLSETSSEKISGFSTSIDSRELFNKVYAKYTVPGETEADQGTDTVTAKWDTTDPEIPLMAKWVNTSKEMTAAQAEALKTAYISDGKTGGLELGFTIEENWDKSQWILNLGKMVTFIGVPDTISSGSTVMARCVGVEFSVQKGTIKATFMPPQTKYPILPKKKKMQKAFQPAEKVGWTETGSRGIVVPPSGGVITPPPTPVIPEIPSEWGLDGEEWTNADLWGSEGRTPDDREPKDFVNPGFEDYKALEYTYSSWDGIWPIDPSTACKDQGNRIYGLDKSNWAVATRVTNGTTEHWNGGLLTGNGKFIEPLPHLYIKKTFMQTNGVLGAIETIDSITPSMLEGCMAEYENNTYTGVERYKSGFEFADWVANGSYYVSVTHSVHHFDGTGYFYWNSKQKIFKKKIDGANGKLTGLWEEDIPPKWGCAFVSKAIDTWGGITTFGHCAPRPNRKLKNLNNQQMNQEAETYLDETFVAMFNTYTEIKEGMFAPSPWTDSSQYNGQWPYDSLLGITSSGPGIPTATIGKNYKINDGYHPYRGAFAFTDQTYLDSFGYGGDGSRSQNIVHNGTLIQYGKYLNVSPNGVPENIWADWIADPGSTGGVARGWLTFFYSYYGGSTKVASVAKVSTMKGGSVVSILDKSSTALEQMKRYDSFSYHFLANPSGYVQEGTGNHLVNQTKFSRMFSFNGRLLFFAPSAQNKLVVRSVKITELGA